MFFIKFFCKENANERNESLLSNCRVQLFFCKYMKYFSFLQVFGLFLLCFQRKNVNLQKNVERFNVKVMAATVLRKCSNRSLKKT